VNDRGEGVGADPLSVDEPAVSPWVELSSPVSIGRAQPEQFDYFYRREYPRVAALARVLTGPIGAEDHAQEAMLVAFRRWREVSQMADPAMWVRRVCVHIATSQVRRRAVEARALLRLGGRREIRSDPAPSDDAFWAAVRALPRRQAQVVALYYLFDLAVAEVAATLQISEGSVKTHLSRARASLALVLAEGGERQ
jgi:RNA polymerase sigma-70 factor (ECF subfamily)